VLNSSNLHTLKLNAIAELTQETERNVDESAHQSWPAQTE
jgi:hypothetical protein